MLLNEPTLLPIRSFFDSRGEFFELFRESDHPDLKFVQENISISKQHVLRGMHYQISEAQSKLLTVLDGEIYDVVVDIHPASPTFRKWTAYELSGEKRQSLFIPDGYAHGFYVMSKTASIHYQVSAYYQPHLERNFRYDDPYFQIVWPEGEKILSKKDQLAIPFEDLR